MTMTTVGSSSGGFGAGIGGGTLPINPSLASALSTHGGFVSSNNIHSSSGASSSSRSNSNSRSEKTNIQALAVHPSLPRVAYLELIGETVTSSNSASKSTSANANASKTGRGTASAKDGNYSQTIMSRQRIVIQQYSTTITNNNVILATLSLENLPSQINNFRHTKSKSSKITNQRLTLASLGQLLTITFLDRDALFWQTARRQYGANTNLDIFCSGSINGSGRNLGGGGGDVVLRADSDADDKAGLMGQGSCLGLQFTNILVILRIFDKQQHYGATSTIPTSADAFTIICCFEGQRNKSSSAIGRGVRGSGNGGDMKVQYTPTSAVVPITNSIVVYGCSDGAMRFHNLVPSMLYSSVTAVTTTTGGTSSIDLPSVDKLPKQNRQSTIKSVRGPNGRNDPVVLILNVDPTYNEVVDHSPRGSGGGGDANGGVATLTSDDPTLVLHSRLLTVCGSGVAYVWDVYVMIDRSSGALRDLNVLPVSRVLSSCICVGGALSIPY